MNGEPTTAEGRYLYAVVGADQARDSYGAVGIEGGAVYSITNGQTAAVVSNVPDRRIRPSRRHLAAHHNLLKSLADEGALLPMSFGIIAHGSEAVRTVLSANHALLVAQLRRVHNKVEMGLRVSWDVPNIFEYFVNTHPELRARRDRLFRAGREPGQVEKIELGRLFDRLLKEDLSAHTERVADVLRPRCFEIERNPPRDEREVMNLACLIGRDAQEEFEKRIFEAAEGFDNNYRFDFNGPWPPYNFVNVDLQM